MRCPSCKHEDSKVIESRDAGEGDSIRRRRECLDCNYRYTTYERVERPNLAVIKKSGEKELFDRRKLAGAIVRAVGKFLNSDIEVENIVSAVEDKLHSGSVGEVSSKQVGDLVLEELAQRNEVAYVRFASVYQSFSSLDEFEEAIKEARSAQKS